MCGAKSHPQQIPFSSLQQVERLICPSSQGDLPAINAPQIGLWQLFALLTLSLCDLSGFFPNCVRVATVKVFLEVYNNPVCLLFDKSSAEPWKMTPQRRLKAAANALVAGNSNSWWTNYVNNSTRRKQIGPAPTSGLLLTKNPSSKNILSSGKAILSSREVNAVSLSPEGAWWTPMKNLKSILCLLI